MRLAAIDIGTNSIHMIVVEVRPDLSIEAIGREKEMVPLRAGGLDGRKLTPDAERLVRTDRLEPRDERKLVRHIDGEIGKYLDQIARAGFERVIGTSGTILSLGAVASAAAGHAEGAPLRSRRIPAKTLRR